MKWIIKCPAPTGSRQRKWDEFRFAHSLRNHLSRRGHGVLIQYRQEWGDGTDAADVVLVLRGRHRYIPRNREALHLTWNLGHMEGVCSEEIRDYDIFAVASEIQAAKVAQIHGRERGLLLPRCTDIEKFNLSLSLPARDRSDFIFVGDGSDDETRYVLDWMRLGYPLRIWGSDWRRWPEAHPHIVADDVDEAQLGRVYGSARAILHDHPAGMRTHGFISGRIYDAIACGLPVISDRHPAVERRFGDAVIYCDANLSPQAAMDRLLHAYPHVFDKVQREAERIRTHDSFDARVADLVEAVTERIRSRDGRGIPPGVNSSGALSAAPMVDGYGDVGEDESIVMVDVKHLDRMTFDDPDGAAVVMPSIDMAKALRTARTLVKRAGMDTKVFLVEDTLRQGFIKTLNDISARLNVKYVVYLAEDAFPGIDWLATAYGYLERSGKGLLAFNCGKWKGRVAAFGMVRKRWVEALYGGPILFPGYRAHKADNELTVIARVNGQYVYDPDSVLVEIDARKVFKENVPEDKALFRKRFRSGFDGLAAVEDLRPLAEAYFVPMGEKSAAGASVEAARAESAATPWDGPESFFHRPFSPGALESLKREYLDKGLDREPDTFVLYRVIGNDLHPRHKKGQSRENLRFILENEERFESCEKRFIVNRIIDPDEERAIIEMLQAYGVGYSIVPFDLDEYRRIGFDLDPIAPPDLLTGGAVEKFGEVKRQRLQLALCRFKNNYVMNNNGARNLALEDGRSRAKWILPFDGNCFVTPSAWERMRGDISASPYLKYFVVPMTRVTANNDLLSDSFVPDLGEEPQVIFRKDATEVFDEDFCYGRRPKVELFWRLGIAGKWDGYKDDAWDQERPALSPEVGQFGVAGWVARLFSGMENLETQDEQGADRRYHARAEAILATLRSLDESLAGASPGMPTSLRMRVLQEEREASRGSRCPFPEALDALKGAADAALGRGPHSVTDKTTLPPSGDKQDYWHPAPYWWPNPKTADGLPYIRRDGERVPGTQMYEPGSERYDRTRLQRLFDDSFTLGLAWALTGDRQYAEHGSRLLERFFVNADTRMNPHLMYGQVRMGHNKNMGAPAGIIEMKDLYFYLDAVRLFEQAEVLPQAAVRGFRSWLETYLDWLLKSPQGMSERAAVNNHGTCYDLQVAAIASFLHDRDVVYETLARAASRIGQQFTPSGAQPDELSRKTTAHYCCFNFQSWINLAELAARWGVDLWEHETRNGAGLKNGARWLVAHMDEPWPYEQIDEFDATRFHPVWFAAMEHVDGLAAGAGAPDSPYHCRPLYFPHDGIRPFWNLGSYGAARAAGRAGA